MLDFHFKYKMTATWHRRFLGGPAFGYILDWNLCIAQLRVTLCWMLAFCPQINALKMTTKKLHFYHIMLYKFWKWISVETTTKKNMQKFCFNDASSIRAVEKWVCRFRHCDFNRSDKTMLRATFWRRRKRPTCHRGE